MSGHQFNEELQGQIGSEEYLLPPTQTSPKRLAMYGINGTKETRQTSITPRKFTRFFTPRSSATDSSRRALFDITTQTNNRNGTQSSPIRPVRNMGEHENSPTSFTREMKRRKLIHDPTSSPESSNPEKGFEHSQSSVSECEDRKYEGYASQPEHQEAMGDICVKLTKSKKSVPTPHIRHIRPIESRGIAGRLLQFSLGSTSISRRQHTVYPTPDWQDETAAFYSRPEDTHFCSSIEGPERCIPFCVEGCNTNSLVAVGDEEGRVRLLESAKAGKPEFKDVYVAFRPHTNAIIDMCFSQDDSLLATASGDQTARVVDMTTQTTISVLAQHSASLKQVKFQPGAANKSVLATSSRDGSVHIWDLRCKSSEGPVQSIHIPLDPLEQSRGVARGLSYGCAVNTIFDAHRPAHWRSSLAATASDGPSRGEVSGRIGDVSVTAVSFLPAGKEHLLVTASEANASVKLWDIRSLHKTRRKTATPISCTALPRTHTQWRHFGITSLSLSGDGSRLYTLCKDNTVYIYSMAHLVLGRASELTEADTRRRWQTHTEQEGLGPLYGFRHPQLHVTSFYVKSAIRAARNGKVEMLALGSSDGCTVLFPTDERYHKENQLSSTLDSGSTGDRVLRQPLRHTAGGLSTPFIDNTIPISYSGTALVRGHDREVGALTWTSDGELVTVGDDFIVRCWREGGDARNFRLGGEQSGRRWASGWADVSADFDLE